ncbi:hypothetical protein [Desulfoplanes sp.]
MDQTAKSENRLLAAMVPVFAVLGLLLILTQIETNIQQELERTAAQNIISSQPEKARPVLEPTLTEKDIETWKKKQMEIN